jgi:hypothetical protein
MIHDPYNNNRSIPSTSCLQNVPTHYASINLANIHPSDDSEMHYSLSFHDILEKDKADDTSRIGRNEKCEDGKIICERELFWNVSFEDMLDYSAEAKHSLSVTVYYDWSFDHYFSVFPNSSLCGNSFNSQKSFSEDIELNDGTKNYEIMDTDIYGNSKPWLSQNSVDLLDHTLPSFSSFFVSTINPSVSNLVASNSHILLNSSLSSSLQTQAYIDRTMRATKDQYKLNATLRALIRMLNVLGINSQGEKETEDHRLNA